MKRLAFLLLAAVPLMLNAQLTDDFNDGNDNGWTRYDPIGSHPALPDIATFTVVNGGYRIETAPSPAPASVGPGRAGSLRMDVTYTDFYITVDLVSFDTNVNQAFGILARTSDVGLGTTDGYAMTWNNGGHDLDISVFTDEAPDGVRVNGNDRAALEPGKSYRMVFSGKGTELTGEIYELPNVDTPVASITGTDATYPSGVAGLIVYDNSSAQTGTTDTTFDNYFALPFKPPRLKIEPLPFSELRVSWPADPPNYVLQGCSELGVNWTDITDNIAEADGVRSWTDSSQSDKRFFRLRP